MLFLFLSTVAFVLRFCVKRATAPQEELSMTKKGTSLGEVVVLHSPGLVWCKERWKGKCNGAEC